jgi:hypothetical protein
MVANRPEFDQFPRTCLMISAARGHDEPAHAVCSGALLLVWSRIVADHASMISIALVA